jgi:hypothetical protein
MFRIEKIFSERLSLENPLKNDHPERKIKLIRVFLPSRHQGFEGFERPKGLEMCHPGDRREISFLAGEQVPPDRGIIAP